MRTIAVVGATGTQGGGVVRALQEHGGFSVRALTRDPDRATGLGDEVRAADLDRPESLVEAFEGAFGVSVNTNSFAGPNTDEVAQGRAAVVAAREAGVEHYIWSTLPNVAEISDGRFTAPHFTNKASVNEAVASAGFPIHTFVEPPFYFQNLISPMYVAAPDATGTPTWSQPAKATARGMHMGDIDQLGELATGAFVNPDLANGKTPSHWLATFCRGTTLSARCAARATTLPLRRPLTIRGMSATCSATLPSTRISVRTPRRRSQRVAPSRPSRSPGSLIGRSCTCRLANDLPGARDEMRQA